MKPALPSLAHLRKEVPAFFQVVGSKPLVFSLTPLILSQLTFLHQKSWFYPTSITSTMVFCLDLCTNLNGLPASPLIPLPSTLNITIRVILLKQLFLLPHFLNMRIVFSQKDCLIGAVYFQKRLPECCFLRAIRTSHVFFKFPLSVLESPKWLVFPTAATSSLYPPSAPHFDFSYSCFTSAGKMFLLAAAAHTFS